MLLSSLLSQHHHSNDSLPRKLRLEWSRSRQLNRWRARRQAFHLISSTGLSSTVSPLYLRTVLPRISARRSKGGNHTPDHRCLVRYGSVPMCKTGYQPLRGMQFIMHASLTTRVPHRELWIARPPHKGDELLHTVPRGWE